MPLNFLNNGYFAGTVGIGTNSPGEKLAVKGDASYIEITHPTATSYSGIKFSEGGTPQGSIQNIGSTFATVARRGNFEIFHNTGGDLTLQHSGGNVGIGTTSPIGNLNINGGTGDTTAQDTTLSLTRTSSTSNVLAAKLVLTAPSTYQQNLVFRIKTTASSAENPSYYSDVMTLNYAGNVGIGEDTPLSSLHVSGPAGNRFTEGLRVERSTVPAQFAMFNYNGGSLNIIATNTAGTGTSMKFQKSNNGSALIDQMVIDTNGDVGINTTSPAFKLDVDGTLGVSDLPFNSSSVSVLVANETIGAETITNGDFATDSDWTKSSNVSISGGQATFTANSAAQYIIQGSLWPANSLSGQKVKLTYTIVSNSLNGGDFRIGGYTGASAFTLNGLVTTVGTHNIILDVRTTAGNDNAIDLYITSAATSGALVIDNVSVKQVTSVSNQIQKRELGTGAFGPTPVGAYLPLAGGTMTGDLRLNDNVDLYLGTGNDFQAYHDGSNTYLRNLTGDFYIRQDRVDASMIFQCDDGAGGLETYFQLEGASGGASPFTVFPDNSTLAFGTGHDFRLYHNGSNNYQENFTGNMYISNYANDSNIQFSSDNGSGGAAVYILLNGSTGSVVLSHYGSTKLETASTGVTVTGDIQIDSALLSNQENTDVDTGTETVASVAIATYTAAFFDFVIKKTTNVRSGTVYACHDGTNVEFTETSTQDLGDTSDVTLSVDISGTNMRLLATVTSDDWSVKSLIRAI